MKMKFWLLVITLINIHHIPVTQAKVYKWVDEQGKVHYSDKPPADSTDNTQVITLENESNVSSSMVNVNKTEQLQPIINNTPEQSKNILLEHISLKLTGIELGENPDIGTAYRYSKQAQLKARNFYKNSEKNLSPLACISDGKLKLNNAKYILGKTQFRDAFVKAIVTNGYKTTMEEDKLFAMQQQEQAELSLAGVITQIQLAHCGDESAVNLSGFSQNSTYIKIHWELFDNLRRKVIYSTDTEGSDHFISQAPRKNGAPLSLSLAFQQALENLLADQKFVAHLVYESKNDPEMSLREKDEQVMTQPKTTVSFLWGQADGQFTEKVSQIQSATATIRTSSGHGSGFLISQDGYLLTNQHVVGQSREVIAILGTQEYIAKVVSSDEHRDVALIKINKEISINPLLMSADQPTVGQSIYVVGTPLDESLEFTVTQGIISAKRNVSEQPFYQTDAAVNPGNSGGPVFDKNGNVIAITVSGLVNRDGSSRNINYLIPITSALDALVAKSD